MDLHARSDGGTAEEQHGRAILSGAAQPRAAGFAELSAVAAAVLALAWVTARVARPSLPIRQVLWLVAGYLPAATAVGWLLTQNLSRAAFVAIASVASAHAAAYFWFGLRALRGGSPWRPFAALLAGVCGCIALYPGTGLDFRVWSLRMAPDQVTRYREAVDDDRSGAELEKVVSAVRDTGYTVEGDTLKTKPRGYPADHPRIELLRHRSLVAWTDFGAPDWLATPAAADRVAAAWRDMLPMYDWLETNVGPSELPPR